MESINIQLTAEMIDKFTAVLKKIDAFTDQLDTAGLMSPDCPLFDIHSDLVNAVDHMIGGDDYSYLIYERNYGNMNDGEPPIIYHDRDFPMSNAEDLIRFVNAYREDAEAHENTDRRE